MKLKFIILFVVATVIAEDTFCQPRSTFKRECNTCSCSNDGKRAVCTLKACPVDSSITPDPAEAPAQVCNPGTRFNDYCNTCGCASDGLSFICTKMLCDTNIWNEDGSLKVDTKSTRVERKIRSAEDTFCQPRSTFKRECNTCSCSNDGKRAACTLKACPVDSSITPDPAEAPAQVCNPGTKFNDYCNTCGCASDGLSFICTKMLCDTNIWNEDGSLKVDTKSTRVERKIRSVSNQVCKPGTAFNDYCNMCGCASDGSSFICTKMLCDKNIWNKDGTLKLKVESETKTRPASDQVCEPGKKFKDYCNTCTCGANGTTSICTRMWCDKNHWNKDGTLKVNRVSDQIVNSDKACEPGKIFRRDSCNICKCAADGTRYACTLKLCPDAA